MEALSSFGDPWAFHTSVGPSRSGQASPLMRLQVEHVAMAPMLGFFGPATEVIWALRAQSGQKSFK